MIYKSLSVALATISLTNASPPKSYYTSIATTGLEAKTYSQLQVFDGRGYYDFINIDSSDVPYLNRITTTSDPDVASITFDPPTGFDYARSVDYLSDFSVPMAVPPTYFAGWSADNDDAFGVVTVQRGVKRTSLAQWTQAQTLSPPAEFDFNSKFGWSLAADHKTHRKLAVGCTGCNSTAEAGQVYLYSPTSPSATSWSQTQVLELPEAAVAAGYTYLGWDVKIHDNVVLAAVDIPNNDEGYAVFSRGPKPEDPFNLQQVVSVKNYDVNAAAVFEETIVLGCDRCDLGSINGAGAVYILYPSTDEFKLKPAGKPRPVQWSVQQILVSPNPTANYHFGEGLSLDRNTLFVSELSADRGYIFKREEQSGKWSQQQIITFSEAYYGTLAGSKLAIRGDSTPKLGFYNLEEKWDCLVLSLEDQFGDGWDIAELLVNAPDGTQDYFAQSCEMTNPLQIRYCPNLASDGGLYSFSIPGALKAKFYWELQWGIFDEHTATWYRGQWDTKMDFHWDPETLSFSPRKMDHVLPTNTSCVPCKTRPTEKPTPVLRRLKGSGGSQAPTYSPAPTLEVSSNLNWRYLNLNVAANPWYDNQYQGTNYYVSDAHGHKLITTGTLCEDETNKQCWVDLPGGDYILRVSGALNTQTTGQTFTYCKAVTPKGVQHQMNFRVAEGDCSIVTFASQAAVCQSLGITLNPTSFYLVLNVNMILHGTTATSLSNAESSVFSAAVASIIPGLTASDVEIVSATPSGSSTYVNANIRLSSALGYNVLDFDGESALEAYLKDIFTSHTKEVNFVAALGAGAVASAFSSVTRAEFVDYRIVDSVEILSHSEVNMVTSLADQEGAVSYSTEDNQSSGVSPIFESAIAGYVLGGVGILFAVGFFLRMSSSAAPIFSSVEPSEVTKTSRMNLSGVTATLTPGDLQELARMEQEYLKIVGK